jgi:chromosomal replication initiator protein
LARRTTWHEYIILPENQSAYKAAYFLNRSILKNSKIGSSFIFIHGETGSGKSYLVSFCERDLGNKILVIPARDFTRPIDTLDCINIPLLVVEDIQFITSEFAERLVSIIDARLARNQKTLMTSSKSPAELTNLSRRLTSRLASGLVIHIPNLSPESKKKLIPHLARQTDTPITIENYTHISEEIQNSGTSMRTLKAALKQKPSQQKDLLSEIVRYVAKTMNIPVSSMLDKSRVKNIVTARQVAAVLAVKDCGINMKLFRDYFNIKGMDYYDTALLLKMAKDERLKLIVENLRNQWKSHSKELVARMLRDSNSLLTAPDHELTSHEHADVYQQGTS